MLYGDMKGKEYKTKYDLLSVILIGMEEDGKESANPLNRLLSIIFKDNLTVEEKKYRLEHEYGIPMTRTMEKEMTEMCNFSDYIEERGKRAGMIAGRSEGISIGRSEGINIGRSEGLRQERKSAIERMLRNHKSPELIAEFCGYDISDVLKVQKTMRM